MSPALKLGSVALLAFALGFGAAWALAAARLQPPTSASRQDGLAWQSDGASVRLTATSPGTRYLVLSGDGGANAPDRSTATAAWRSDAALTVRSPATVYQLVPRVRCDPGEECNQCSKADDCPPPPRGPEPPWSLALWSPSVDR